MQANPELEKPRILLCENFQFAEKPLSNMLEESGCLVVRSLADAEEPPDVGSIEPPPDLVMMSFQPSDPEVLERIRCLRASPRARQIPILGVTTLGSFNLDIQLLRAHGMVGLIDRNTLPEHVVDRVNQIVRPLESRRVCERVACFLPVEVTHTGFRFHEYALNLSVTGMRITSQDSLEPNTDMAFRFRLRMVSDDVLEARGRVVYQSPKRNSDGRFEAGVAFYPLARPARRLIEREMARLLSD